VFYFGTLFKNDLYRNGTVVNVVKIQTMENLCILTFLYLGMNFALEECE